MKSNEAFKGAYLKHSDLGGRKVGVTIEEVTMQKIGDDDKPVASFRGKDKGLVLNQTNWHTIADVLGSDDSDDWTGKRIVLMPAKTEFQGKRVDCIRVSDEKRDYAGNGSNKPAPPPPPVEEFDGADDSDVPF